MKFFGPKISRPFTAHRTASHLAAMAILVALLPILIIGLLDVVVSMWANRP